jgi:uncharacterized membrane protein
MHYPGVALKREGFMASAKSSALPASFRAHPRLFIGAGFGVAVGLALPPGWRPITRMVTGWDTAAVLYLALSLAIMLKDQETRIRRRAQIADESGFTILILSAASAAASMGALIGLLSGFHELPADLKTPHLMLVAFTIVCAWFFLQTLFTLHYAHEYYGSAGAGGAERGGLKFSGSPSTLRYLDFAYFAFTIGVTAQTSDTAVTSPRMRRLTLAHSILAFFFNTIILALSVNIAASLL